MAKRNDIGSVMNQERARLNRTCPIMARIYASAGVAFTVNDHAAKVKQTPVYRVPAVAERLRGLID